MSMVPGGSAGGQLEDLKENLSLINSGIEWKETAEAHVLRAEFPGLRKEELKVEVEADGVVEISGERCLELVETTDDVHRVERSPGKFVRRFKLPDNANVDEIKSTIEQGVLTVTVPKMQPQPHLHHA